MYLFLGERNKYLFKNKKIKQLTDLKVFIINNNNKFIRLISYLLNFLFTLKDCYVLQTHILKNAKEHC